MINRFIDAYIRHQVSDIYCKIWHIWKKIVFDVSIHHKVLLDFLLSWTSSNILSEYHTDNNYKTLQIFLWYLQVFLYFIVSLYMPVQYKDIPPSTLITKVTWVRIWRVIMGLDWESVRIITGLVWPDWTFSMTQSGVWVLWFGSEKSIC